MLGEAVTTAIAKNKDAIGFEDKGGSKNYDIVIPTYAGIPCLCGL